ncbi:aminopeptidase [Aureibacillus halotolerans]|uniref:Leucyl aminopeptidase (Aminopeptidase T) n=1 Tax=Aureibacillus halotolerans TaxID=1508390 RepID=A0A4R6TSI1_9BACI|nr:aminopeptidase [Aureibacillus halotolerans]TDQ36261.1 leucyl aminopeptidase (aminopeptidase T) [Aureibacillus halotolerans]
MTTLQTFIPIIDNMMQKNVLATGKEHVVVLADLDKEDIGRLMFDALCQLGYACDFAVMQTRERSGEEPPATIAALMKASDICFCVCEHSLTHTEARKAASTAGTKVVTMPGITMDMFTEGAMKADYTKVKKLTAHFTEQLHRHERITIKTGPDKDHLLTLNIADRQGIPSAGVFEGRGHSGNLPSGESFIAPQMEDSTGSIYIDGSIAGIGKVAAPVVLTVEEGRLVDASGEDGARLLELLGKEDGRCIAEFGIGTNTHARVTGNILEDEKAYGTIHVAFGSNKTFGGTIDAGVHLDCVTLTPTVHFGDTLVVDQGQVLDTVN